MASSLTIGPNSHRAAMSSGAGQALPLACPSLLAAPTDPSRGWLQSIILLTQWFVFHPPTFIHLALLYQPASWRYLSLQLLSLIVNIIIANPSIVLSRARHCPKYLACINSFNLQNNPGWWTLISIPILWKRKPRHQEAKNSRMATHISSVGVSGSPAGPVWNLRTQPLGLISTCSGRLFTTTSIVSFQFCPCVRKRVSNEC